MFGLTLESDVPENNQEKYVGKILIIDDEQDFALSLEDVLSSRNYQVAVVFNFDDALKRAAAFKPDIALVDIQLGQVRGTDLLLQLKEVCPNLLCVMITAFATVETAIEALQRGADDYLRKPLDINEFLVRIEHYFNQVQLILLC